MKGVGCTCPRCGAPERVSPFVLGSGALSFSHRCRNCGIASVLAEWTGSLQRPVDRRRAGVAA